jgi:hypothetical protein
MNINVSVGFLYCAILLSTAIVFNTACTDVTSTVRTNQSIESSKTAAKGQTSIQTNNQSEAGDILPEPATFHSLAARWVVKGDSNRDASVSVRYRADTETEWNQAFPLFRTNSSKVIPENRVSGGWLFAGSIVNLKSNTEYEIELSLVDPDGGDIRRTLRMRTASEPKQPPNMRVRYVVPFSGGGTGNGTKDDPYKGLIAAQATAEPGDLFILESGTYVVGRWEINRHGKPGKPIVYRGASDSEVILDGNGASRLVSANNVQHVWFENLTFRNAKYLIVAHDGGNMVVRDSKFEITKAGIEAINGGYIQSRGFVITDNLFKGTTSWPRTRGIEEVNAIKVTGSGHVIAYNRIERVGDGIHGSKHGGLSASDIYSNDIHNCTDDGIETDYSDTNVRVFYNRITNCFAGISGQPVRGGPVYVFRNSIYNTQYSPFKLHNHTSGILIFHNTSVKAEIPFNIQPGQETVNDVMTRNNLFVGTVGPGLSTSGRMRGCDFDNDGYGGIGGWWFGGPFAVWNGKTYFSPKEAKKSEELYTNYGTIPQDFRRSYSISQHNPKLAGDSEAIDRGIFIANFSDNFNGKAPDLGCCEYDKPLPKYGPRRSSKSKTRSFFN